MPRADTASFDEFWRVFPKKCGRPIAKAKWDAITGEGLTTRTLDKDSGTYITIELRATPEEIIAGAKRYRATQIDPRQCRSDDYSRTILKDDGKFTCHPATWLNQGRWLDED
jgi:hypothetical protein